MSLNEFMVSLNDHFMLLDEFNMWSDESWIDAFMSCNVEKTFAVNHLKPDVTEMLIGVSIIVGIMSFPHVLTRAPFIRNRLDLKGLPL